MSPRQPKTKEQVLTKLVSDIVSDYFEDQKGVVRTITKSELSPYLSLAEKNKDGSHSAYYLVKALLNTVNDEFVKAERNCNNARRLAPNDVVILSNYSLMLLRLYRYSEAREQLKELINKFNCLEMNAVQTGLNDLPLLTLNTDFFRELEGVIEVPKWSKHLKYIEDLKKDIGLIDISVEQYTEFMEILENFVTTQTRQRLKPRFKVINGLDKNLVIEIFINMNIDEMAYLDSKFTTKFLDYVFDEERHNLLGKFIVFFRQSKNRYDGVENPDALYLGMDEELVA